MLAAVLAAVAFAAPAAHDWTRFDYDAKRSGVYPFATGITAANAGRLQRQRVELDGTVDSSPIFLHDVAVGGARRDAFFMTTTYGRTIAIDAANGHIVWRHTPSGYSSLAGTYRITNATPVADPSRTAIYIAGPDGRIRKLAVSDGHELWSTAITLLPCREKIAPALNFARGLVIAATGGYVGDAPPYQGHVVTLRRSNGAIVHVWNSLCSDRHALINPSSCRSSDSAIWARSGAVVEPSGRLLVATGNGPWNGRTDWGDSVLELSADARRLLQNWTPRNADELESADADLGSTAPALLGGGLALQAGKDGKVRLLNLRRLNGTPRAGARKGGELQSLSTPGGVDLFTAPAVWHQGRTTWTFVADGAGTAAYRLVKSRLRRVWQNSHAGTSPVVAGGLLYLYDPAGGELRIYRPTTGSAVASLPAGAGHWNSPIVVAGMVALPEGDANEHRQSGVLDIYRLP